MGRPKGGKNRYYSKEIKFKYVQRVLNGEIGKEIEKETGVSEKNIFRWLKQYNEGGIEALENKRNPGNPLVKFQNRKNLSELEQLQYENMKLRIENLRLKKGYTNEEAVIAKQRKLSKKNTK